MQTTYSSLAAFAASVPVMTPQQAQDVLAALAKITGAGGTVDHAALLATCHKIVGDAPVTASQQLSAHVSSDHRAQIAAHFGLPTPA